MRLLTLPAVSQPGGCEIRYLGFREGLPDRHVTAVCHDYKGIVWLGTKSGLYRYDGYAFSFFDGNSADQGEILGNNWIMQLFEDASRHLWIRSTQGLAVLSPDLRQSAFLKGYCFLAQSDDNTIFVSINRQVFKLKAIYINNSLTIVKTPLPVAGDMIFKASGLNGLWVYETSSGKMTFWQHDSNVQKRYQIPVEDDMDFLNYGNGVFVAYATGAPFYFDSPSQSFLPFPHTDKGELTNPFVLKTRLNEFIGKHDPLLPTDLSSQIQLPTCVEPDRHGHLWVGTTFGLFVIAQRNTQFRHLPPLIGKATRAIYGNERNLFVSASDRLYRFDNKSGQLVDTSGKIPASRVMLPLGPDSLLLAGEYNDLFIVDCQNFKKPSELLKDQTRHHFSSLIATDGRLWLGGRDPDVWRFHPGRSTKRDLAFYGMKQEAMAMVQDAQGNIWAGGYDELYQIKGSTLSQNFLADQPPGCIVFCAYAQGNLLWLGTRGRGLFCFNMTAGKIVRKFTTADGLPNNIINCILPDDNRKLWLSTNQGLSLFDPLKGEFLNFSTADGLLNEEFNAASAWRDTATGMIYFGGLNGVTFFQPRNIKKKAVQPEVFISKIIVPGQQEGRSDVIYPHQLDIVTLAPGAQFIEFRLGSTDYMAPDLNMFLHKLEGFDDNWVSHGNNPVVLYTSLPAGRYIFKYKTVNRDGHPSPEKQIVLLIKQVFYKTWWFISCMLLLLIATAYAAYQYRVRQIRQIYQVKKQIADDLHDDVATSLSQISMLVKTIKAQHPDPSLHQVENLSDQSIGKLSDIVWAIDDKRQTLDDLANRLQDYAESVFHPLHIRLRVQTELANPERNVTSTVRHHTVMIFKEAVNNIIRHTKSNTVQIQLVNLRSELLLTIENYFEITQQSPYSTGKGLESMANRANIMRGDILIDHTEHSFRLMVKVPHIFEKKGFSL